jgi:hypothetical protein
MQETLWEIARKVAETDLSAYNYADNRVYCSYCDANVDINKWINSKVELLHKPDCIVVKARALVEQRKHS